MATTLTGQVKIQVAPSITKALDLTTPQDSMGTGGTVTWNITNGTAVNQADVLWHDQRTLTSGQTDDLDLSGVLTDAFGDTFTAARIKAIYIKTSSATTANLLIGGAVTNPISTLFADTSDKIKVRGAGGAIVILAPDATAYAVTAGSADVLRITHDSSTSDNATYDIIVIGASA